MSMKNRLIAIAVVSCARDTRGALQQPRGRFAAIPRPDFNVSSAPQRDSETRAEGKEHEHRSDRSTHAKTRSGMFKVKAIMMSLLVGASLAAHSQTSLNETPAESSQISAAALPPGSLDPTFKKSLQGFGFGGFATHIAKLPDGKALIVFQLEGGVVDGDREAFIVVRRHNEDGSLDRTFGGPGNIQATLRDTAGGSRHVTPTGITITPEGRIFIAATGSDPTFADDQIIRPIIFGLTPSGTLNANFDGNGLLFPFSKTFSIDNNHIFTADLSYDSATKRLTMGGTIDPKSGNSFFWTYTVNVNQTSFTTETTVKENGSNLHLRHLVRRPTGEMVMAGEVSPSGGGSLPTPYLARQLANGLVLGKRPVSIGSGAFVEALEFDNNKVFLTGAADTSGTLDFEGFVARFDVGTLFFDASFGSNGVRFVSKDLRDMKFAKDKKILVAGSDGTDYLVSRLSYNGQTDTTFGTNGEVLVNFSNLFDERALALSIDGKNRIWVGGSVEGPEGRERAGLVRLLP